MDNIRADMVFEILGRPAEHLKLALSQLIEKLCSEKGMKILNKTVHEPVEVKETKNLYTTFAEVSLECDLIENFMNIIFNYMPAHIEIISPTNLSLSNLHMNELSNKMLARLHNYDAITKKFIYERDFLLHKMKDIAPELFKEVGISPMVNQEMPEAKPEASKEKAKAKKKTAEKLKKRIK